jgi:Uma2 family endonuclease
MDRIMLTTGSLTSAEQLLAMPDDGLRHELVAGELKTMAAAGARHGIVTNRIAYLLTRHVMESGLGSVFAAETGFILARDPDTVRAPDVAFVSRDRLADTRDFFPGPPDLAVEVTSPSDRFSEVQEKAFSWLRAGCRLVLVADPASAMVTAYRSPTDIRASSGEEVVDCDDVVRGWRERAAAFFE